MDADANAYANANANANANADAGGSTITLRELRSGELKVDNSTKSSKQTILFQTKYIKIDIF